jgi:glycosyltransferase involved in cell wall biosynthesis
VVDLFYKIKYLHQLGVNIHLHCFTHQRPPQPELDKYCAEVHYYVRKRNLGGLSYRIPFIAQSRASKELVNRLNQDSHPILLEGIHCTYHLFTGELKDRPIVVRLHNVEFDYYRHLAQQEHNPLKKAYFSHESKLLHRYERALANKAIFLAVSQTDEVAYRQQLGAQKVHFLPVFTPHTMASCKEGQGNYCLYHGNLSVNENARAAEWLLKEVFSKTQVPLVIAGKNPSAKLERLAHHQQHTCLVANPGEAELQDLIARAQVNILPSFNNTGVKLKLINAVFNGRHCLVNEAAVKGSGLAPYCHIAEGPSAFVKAVEQLFTQSFLFQEIEERQGGLERVYNNQANAEKLINLLR